ncbi:MAG TPA: GNAT family N-acyltransferase, partial [Tepidisphaeraceae bacterium]|nr:GNAT family N-acyltransferase [Tepidisphaeraceae bacterium]
HRYGGVEGMILPTVLGRVRRDVKLMVNELLECIPELRPMCFFVNVFGSNAATASNTRALKQTFKHLRDGGSLGGFPAGAVSHLQMSDRRVSDPPWSPHVAGLIRRTRATVVPMYFTGRNGMFFQLAGLVHPRLRTALLPRQMANKQQLHCRVEIGSVIRPDELADFETDEQAIQYLRHRTYALAERATGQGGIGRTLRASWRKLTHWRRGEQPLAPPVGRDELERELHRLPSQALLACNGDLCVYVARWDELDAVARELGRLRELTFRGVGEGTGKPADIDEFDPLYRHLLVWNRQKRELVGSYRMGLLDEITDGKGVRGMYLSTLFDFDATFLNHLGNGIELGRSFVRPEYQKSFSPLMLLWRGIGAFIARHPSYRALIGPVSISNRYTLASRATIATALLDRRHLSPLSTRVSSKTPFVVHEKTLGREIAPLGRLVRSVDELCDVIADMEPDGKSLPILLKQYLKLGARTLAFNVDPAFGNCLDCLCVLDLLHADRRQVQRYMGKDLAAGFYAMHDPPVAPLPRDVTPDHCSA